MAWVNEELLNDTRCKQYCSLHEMFAGQLNFLSILQFELVLKSENLTMEYHIKIFRYSRFES